MMKKTKHENEKQLKLEKEAEEYKNKYLRALADYQNLEKRTEAHTVEIRKKVEKDIILKFLDILDGIDNAEVFIKDSGLKLIKDKFLALLKGEGVEEIDITGKPFNPYLAECMQVVPGEKDNVVIGVVQKGYAQYGELIRPARVKVSKSEYRNPKSETNSNN